MKPRARQILVMKANGDVIQSNNYGPFVIIDYKNALDVTVKFVNTGYEYVTRAECVRAGNVKDKMLPIISGVGFIGKGDYKTSIGRKKQRSYIVWLHMIERCYSDEARLKNPTYVDCTVHVDWHNYQNFARWYYENYPNDGADWFIDKDIKTKGNRTYSPEFCIFTDRQSNNEEAHAMSFSFISPDGEVVYVYNLAKFCRDNDLNDSHMLRVNKGSLNQHKGWRRHEGKNKTDADLQG